MPKKNNDILLVLPIEEISLRPEVSSPPRFRIQGGSPEPDIHSSRKQELEARQPRTVQLEADPPQVLPLELELSEPHQRHRPITKRQVTDHYLAKRQPKRLPLDESISSKSTMGVQETKEDEDKRLSVEDLSINRVTQAKLIMVKPANIVVTLDNTAE